MSCLQATPKSPLATKDTKDTRVFFFKALSVHCGERRSIGNDSHLSRLERFKKPARLRQIELLVACFDAQEKSIAARQREPRDIKHRVIRLRQPVEREHAQDRRECRAE